MKYAQFFLFAILLIGCEREVCLDCFSISPETHTAFGWIPSDTLTEIVCDSYSRQEIKDMEKTETTPEGFINFCIKQ